MDELPEKSNDGCDLFDDFNIGVDAFLSPELLDPLPDGVLFNVSCDFDRGVDAALPIEQLVDLMYDGIGLSDEDDVDWTELVEIVFFMTLINYILRFHGLIIDVVGQKNDLKMTSDESRTRYVFTAEMRQNG